MSTNDAQSVTILQIAYRDEAKRKNPELVNSSVTTQCDKDDTPKLKIGSTH